MSSLRCHDDDDDDDNNDDGDDDVKIGYDHREGKGGEGGVTDRCIAMCAQANRKRWFNSAAFLAS